MSAAATTRGGRAATPPPSSIATTATDPSATTSTAGPGTEVAPHALTAAALGGARAMGPMVLGVLPLGFAIGAAIGASDVPDAAGLLGGLAIFGGAAQLTTVEMLDAGTAPLVVVVSALLVNARVLVYGAALGRWFREESLAARLVLAMPVIDPLYFAAVARFGEGDLDRRERRAFYLGAAATLAVAWLGVQVVAVVAGASLPEWLGLHLAAPLAFAGLLARSLPDRRAVGTAVLAAAASVALVGMPLHSSVLLATVLAVALGAFGTRRGREGGRS